MKNIVNKTLTLTFIFYSFYSNAQETDWKQSFNNSSSCEIDLHCNNFNLIEDITENLSRSSVVFEIRTGELNSNNTKITTSKCSATILAKENNANPNPEYYILTARHCLHKDITGNNLNMGLGALFDTDSVRLHFNKSKPNDNALKPAFLNHFAQGSITIIEESLVNDMALVKFNSDVPPHFKPYFSGWSASLFLSNAFSGDFYSIHHPSTDVTKYTSAKWYNVYDGAVAVPVIVANAPLIGALSTLGGLQYRYFALLDKSTGLVEGGSSGSSFYNDRDKLIGVFSASLVTENDCNFDPDKVGLYTKFRPFFLGNQSVRNALGVSLPQMSLSGKELTCYNSLIGLNGNFYPANSYQPNNAIALNSASVITTNGNLKIISGADFTFTAAESIDLLPGFEVEAGAEFTAEIAPCANLNYRMAQPQEEYMTRADSLYMDSLIINNITPFKEDSAAWFNIMQAYYPHILQNQDSLELYWSYLGYGPLRSTNAKSVNSNKKDYTITDYKLSIKSVNLTSTIQKITIYPNPNKGEFVLGLSNAPKGNYSLQITDAVGRRVMLQQFEVQEQNLKQNINLQAYGKGIYFIKINSEQINEVRKVVVE